MQNKKILNILFFLIITGSSGCANISTPNIEKITPEVSIPTPLPGKAVIYGYLFNKESHKPISGVPFLARALISENPDVPITVSFSNQNDTGADYDAETGFFLFENIEPADNYVILIVFGPGNRQVVREHDSEIPLIISIDEDESLDLGSINFEEN